MLEIDLIAEAEKLSGKTLEEEYGEALGTLLRKNYIRAVYLHTTPGPGVEVMPNSWFGGAPNLPADIPWPVYAYGGVDYPMSFVMQLDCADVPKLEEYPFPEKGNLFFFYEFHLQLHRRQSNIRSEGGAVIYVKEVTGIPPRSMPIVPPIPPHELSDMPEEDLWIIGAEKIKTSVFPKRLIEPIVFGEIYFLSKSDRLNNKQSVCDIYKDITDQLQEFSDKMVKKIAPDSFDASKCSAIFGKSGDWAIEKIGDGCTKLLSNISSEEQKYFSDFISFYAKYDEQHLCKFTEFMMSENWQ